VSCGTAAAAGDSGFLSALEWFDCMRVGACTSVKFVSVWATMRRCMPAAAAGLKEARCISQHVRNATNI
jgi:hypothetical protein